MNVLTSFKSKVPYIATSVALLVAVVAPGVISTHAFAAQVTERSIALSSSSASASAVTYTTEFTAPTAAGAFAIDFCSNTPDPLESCTAPTGFTAASASSTTTDFTDVTGATNRVIVVGTIAQGATINVAIDGITNPSVVGPLYARIATFADETNAIATTPKVDSGSVAISITDTIGVSGAVLESMTFCVSGAEIDADCATTTSPVLKLGETVGSVVALTPTAVSTGSIYTQISTNATSGAVINLKSATDCGGLKRVGAAACDIVPALVGDITANEAKFGVKTTDATSTSGVADAGGTLQPFPTSGYGNGLFAFNYLANNSTGVTSTIGDPFLDTAGAPANNQNMELIFGASVTNATPAGNYSTSLSMIATGKF